MLHDIYSHKYTHLALTSSLGCAWVDASLTRQRREAEDEVERANIKYVGLPKIIRKRREKER